MSTIGRYAPDHFATESDIYGSRVFIRGIFKTDAVSVELPYRYGCFIQCYNAGPTGLGSWAQAYVRIEDAVILHDALHRLLWGHQVVPLDHGKPLD